MSGTATFEHRQTAHCESGVVSALLRESGTSLTEAMVFGLASGLTFAYLPFVTIGGQPLISYRMPPGAILKGIGKRLGVQVHSETFGSVDAGMTSLDRHLADGRVVGLQTSVYWLPYFPPDMRFHFNAHNLLVYGRRNGSYLISDPVIEHPVECDAESLARARFVKGALAPKGRLYFLGAPKTPFDLARQVRKAIRFTTGMMLYTPLPMIGIRGIRMMARKIARLDANNPKPAKLMLGHVVRMQEEIGTGGAGFRFLYSAFLQEASRLAGLEELAGAATELTAVGDAWRQFALSCARMCKGNEPLAPSRAAETLMGIADLEKAVYRRLRAAVA